MKGKNKIIVVTAPPARVTMEPRNIRSATEEVMIVVFILILIIMITRLGLEIYKKLTKKSKVNEDIELGIIAPANTRSNSPDVKRLICRLSSN